MNDARRSGLGSIPIWKCPSRRSGIAIADDGRTDNGNGAAMSGPRGDYAFVYSTPTMTEGTGTYTNDTHCTGSDLDCWSRCTAAPAANQARVAAANFGPLRLALYTNFNAAQTDPTFRLWKVRDKISWWASGTSNQIVIGEKHIPKGKLEQCDNSSANSQYTFDCSILCTHNNSGNAGQHGRAIQQGIHSDGTPHHRQAERLLRPDDHSTGVGSRDSGFGSYHPGVCHFLIGDGSVQSFGLTTAYDILCAWANVKSNRSVSP